MLGDSIGQSIRCSSVQRRGTGLIFVDRFLDLHMRHMVSSDTQQAHILDGVCTQSQNHIVPDSAHLTADGRKWIIIFPTFAPNARR